MDVTRKDATITNTSPEDDFPGSFEVILSAPTKDRDGDTLLPSEWKQPLPDHITFDMDHGMSVAATVGSGVPSIDEKTGNLVVAGTYSSLQRAQEVRTLVNEGHIRTTSVAFMSEKSEEKDGKSSTVRELLNGAFVAIPSNREALVLASKAAKADTAAERLQVAKEALVATGYFTADQVGDDIAPRIVELYSALAVGKRPALKAVAGSLEATQARVSDALNDAYGSDSWVWLRATIPAEGGGTCVFEVDATDGSDSDTFQQDYTDDGGVVALTGDRSPVDLVESIKPDPDEDAAKSAAESAAVKAADDDAADAALLTRVQALSLSVSTYTD